MQAIGKYRWTICALLFFATTINYLDRQVLSLLQPRLAELFNWSNSDYANITSVFQFVYAISMLFAGRIIDKLGTKKGYVWAIIIWSVGALIHALAIPMGQGISVVLGWVGIIAVPVSIAGFMISRAVLATGIFNSGANVGAVLAPLTVPWIGDHWGWEYAFIIIGAIGFLWLAFWIWMYDKPEQQKKLSAAELAYIKSDKDDEPAADPAIKHVHISWVKLLGYKQTWAFVFGKFMTDGVWWFFLFCKICYDRNCH